MPSLSAKELSSALRLQAEEALQLSREQLVVEWHVHQCGTAGAGGKPITGIFAAAPVADIERELEILNIAGLDPVILDVRAFAAVNLYSTLRHGDDGQCVCLINLSPHSADVMVRTGIGELYPHTVYCRASTWVESPGFLADNARDVLRYCEYKLGWEPAGRVVLMGESASDPALIAGLEAVLKMGVEYWNPLAEIKIKPGALAEWLTGKCEAAGCLAPVMGMALRRT